MNISMFLKMLGDFIELGFKYIFPEFPFIGVVVLILGLTMFAYYALRSGLIAGIKVGLAVSGLIIFCLFAFHQLSKLASL